MVITKNQIEQLTKQKYSEVVDIRRHLHQYPELSYHELKTSEYITKHLNKIGIPNTSGFVETGILGWLEGKNPDKKTIAIRCDMDALPIEEQNNHRYRSTVPGVMHACGHDAHMAALLVTASVLAEIKNNFEGRVLFVFQPAEEKIPGGAKGMIEQGVFDKYRPDIVLAQHVMPELKAGTIGIRPGVYMASTDEIYITVKGKGGHAAIPDQLIDPVLIASHIIIALQQISSRLAPAHIPTVLSFGKIEARGANNIIPPEVKIAGTFRTMNEVWRKAALKKINDIASFTAQGMGGKCSIDIKSGYPMLKNSPEICSRLHSYASDILGSENILELEPQMTAEDFAYFLQEIPGALFRLGTKGVDDNYSAPLHSPNFDLDESALLTSVKLLSWLSLCFLNET